MNILFLVGPDMTGKTNIAKELSKRLNIPYYKASSEHHSFLKKQDRFIHDIRYACPARLDLLKQIGGGIVFDRGYPCQWVYSKFFERDCDDEAVFWLDDQYSTLGAKIIFCTRHSFANISDDLDPNLDETSLKKISSLYDEFNKLTKCDVLKLFVDDENLKRELKDILNFINH